LGDANEVFRDRKSKDRQINGQNKKGKTKLKKPKTTMVDKSLCAETNNGRTPPEVNLWAPEE